jgi:hypothetical protein
MGIKNVKYAGVSFTLLVVFQKSRKLPNVNERLL